MSATDAGYYTVVVTNQYGAATSVNARLSVTVGARPALAGFWPPLAGSNVFAVVVEGDLGYIAAGDAGLVVADMSNPAAPVWVSQYDTSGSARGVFVAGPYAYVADGPGGLVILDVSNPANPLLVERHATGGTAFAVRVAGSLAMVAAGDAGLVLVNVANPANPSRLSAFDTAGDSLNVFIKSNHAFIADGTNGLVILDLNNPASPAPVGGYPAEGGVVYDVAVLQNRAFLAAGTNGVVVLDVSNPAAPARVGGFATAGEALRLQVLGSRVYVANGSGGLAMLDFENPAAPSWVGEYITGGEVRFVLVARNQALLADGEYGLGVLNLDAPAGDLPSILQHPAGRMVTRGQTAAFRVTARGTGALDFQWYKDGLALTNNTRVSGATTSELTVLGAQPGDAGHYAVIITNLAGATTSEAALLEVIWPPAITEQPQSLLLDVGSEARFNVTAVGDPPLVFQWRLNGANLPDATEASLRIPSVESRHTGMYAVVVGNPYGSATSSVARLSLLLAPWINRLAFSGLAKSKALGRFSRANSPMQPPLISK